MKQTRIDYTRLQDLMEREKMSMEMLSYFSGIVLKTLQRILKAGTPLTIEQGRGIAAALGITKPEDIEYYFMDLVKEG